ncbi:aminopeptidase N-like [Mya arenaria]|uniref:aminopeptidase N-like n=1 Tax=Mya arenaria TaxID=6604 RepID=UPI0022DFCD5C|nr:aminopeptidase N-like [Mya arenaria]
MIIIKTIFNMYFCMVIHILLLSHGFSSVLSSHIINTSTTVHVSTESKHDHKNLPHSALTPHFNPPPTATHVDPSTTFHHHSSDNSEAVKQPTTHHHHARNDQIQHTSSASPANTEVTTDAYNAETANGTHVANAISDAKVDTKDIGDAGDRKNCISHYINGLPERYMAKDIYTICNLWPDPHTDIRLPTDVIPERYHVDMFPHIYNESDFTFDCNTTILIYCNEDTDIIHLHSMEHGINFVEINILGEDVWTHKYEKDILEHTNNPGKGLEDADNLVKRSLTDDEQKEQTTPHEYTQAPHDEETDELKVENCGVSLNVEMLHIKLNKPLKKGARYKLTINSKSKISNGVMGFYASPYMEKETCKEKFVFTSLMEPTHARYVFPCFDEPDFKAVFTMTIKRLGHVTSVMNLPLRKTIGPDVDGFFIDVFDQPQDVKMSSYLVALGIAELEYIEAYYKDIRSRVWTRKDILNHTTYLLDTSVQFLEFFEDFFQIPYPLPKLDAITVPDMSFSGMEHWGLITYKESAVVYDPPSSEQIVWQTSLISHEIAHQWFGNLVSPYWWDDLWLNEGFATYMMYMATEAVMPDLDMKNRVAIDYRGIQNVLRTDQKTTSHPVYMPVYHPQEIQDIFDLISYAKGGAVIRMMNFFLGDYTFKHGLRRYLIRHSSDTATHNDLFAALSEQAVDDGLDVTDVKSVMDTWILEQNYPVVTIEITDSSVCFNQTAFLETEEGRMNRSHITWKIPVTCTSSEHTDFDQKPADIIWLNEKRECVEDSKWSSADWVVCNLKQIGFFRVNYANENWRHIIGQLKKDPLAFHTINRAQIINDAWELQRAGLLDIEIALQTFEYLDLETEFAPWWAAIRELNTLSDYLKLTPKYGLFQNFIKKKMKAMYFKSGSKSSIKEKLLHSLISKHACKYELEACVDDALDLYKEWIADDNIRLDPDMVETVFCTAARNLDDKRYNAPKKLLRNPGLLKDYRKSLACVDKPWQVIRVLENVLDIPELYELGSSLTSSATGRWLTWIYFMDFWKRDSHKASGMLEEVTEKMSTAWELNQLRQFMAVAEMTKGDTGAFEAAERVVSARVEYIETHRTAIYTWLQGITEVQD